MLKFFSGKTKTVSTVAIKKQKIGILLVNHGSGSEARRNRKRGVWIVLVGLLLPVAAIVAFGLGMAEGGCF